MSKKDQFRDAKKMMSNQPGAYSRSRDAAQSLTHSDLLESLTLQQRLMAAANHYEKTRPEFAEGLRHAIELIGKDGWEHIAPSWAKGIVQF